MKTIRQPLRRFPANGCRCWSRPSTSACKSDRGEIKREREREGEGEREREREGKGGKEGGRGGGEEE